MSLLQCCHQCLHLGTDSSLQSRRRFSGTRHPDPHPLGHAVRQIDRRDPSHPSTLVEVVSRGDNSAPALRTLYLSRRAVDLNSIDAPASKPHLFAVGGSDTWLRVYDRRMAAGRGSVKVLNPPSSCCAVRLLGCAFHQLCSCCRARVCRAVSVTGTFTGGS